MGGTRRDPAHADPQPERSAPVAEVADKQVEEPANEAAPESYRFQVLADREARWSESRYFRDFAIGHSWVRLIDPTGAVDSWGYWPDLEGGHAVDPSHPWKSIPGHVRHPDTAHVPNAILSFDIDAKTAQKVAKFGNAKEAAPGMYNLFTYNCTTFAIEMANTAGVSAPSASTLGLKNPNDLYAGIQAMNADRGLDVMGRAPEPTTPEE